MSALLEKFIEFMALNEAAPRNPAEIKPDDVRHYYAIEGDNGGRKSGAYCLKTDGNFGVGWFINYRIGETITWTSKAAREFSPAERSEWRARIAAERAANEVARRKLANEVAEKAEKIWAKAEESGEHPYLARKGINLNGARILDGKIVVPAMGGLQHKGGTSSRPPPIRTLQFIDANGGKLFLKGGEKKGCYFKLPADWNNPKTIVICEGYATGGSLAQVLALPVVVAFDAGNLKPTLTALLKEYPEAQIIIAADNDAWTPNQKFKPEGVDFKTLAADDERWDEWLGTGHLVNTGIEKAQAAAKDHDNVRVIIPAFRDVMDRPTDWNDLYRLEGAAAVKTIFARPVAPWNPKESICACAELPPEWMNEIPFPENEESAAQVQLYAKNERREIKKDWRKCLLLKKDGSINTKSITNVMAFLENEAVLSNIFCFDEFSCEKIVYQCPPWENPLRFKPRTVRDTDITYLTAYLEKWGFGVGTIIIQKALDAAIKRNPRNPAFEYFDGLKWDGVERLNNWLRDFCTATKEPHEYVSAVGRKWLCAAVKRVFEAGAKFDHMLILEGKQDTGKSTLLKELATIHGTAYFDDTIQVNQLGTKDAVMKFQGVLIIELAELTGIHKKDANELKQQITQTRDRIVLKYENEATYFPRKFVLAGSLNPILGHGYLTDVTGNRRFWPVTTGRLYIEELKAVKEQLWAEAAHAVKHGEKLFLEGELYRTAEKLVKNRLVEHPWRGEIDEYLRYRQTVSKDDLWAALDIKDRTKRNAFNSGEISKIMMSLGYVYKRIREDGERKYLWVRLEEEPRMQEEIEF